MIHGAPSGPTITPCGADPSPSLMWRVSPLAGSSRPNSPEPWAVYQTAPSGAGATSCGCEPAGTGYSCSTGAASCAVGAGDGALCVAWAGAVAGASVGTVGAVA